MNTSQWQARGHRDQRRDFLPSLLHDPEFGGNGVHLRIEHGNLAPEFIRPDQEPLERLFVG